MRRINLLAVFTLILSLLILAKSQSLPTPKGTLRRVQVNAKTITALPSGKKYATGENCLQTSRLRL